MSCCYCHCQHIQCKQYVCESVSIEVLENRLNNLIKLCGSVERNKVGMHGNGTEFCQAYGLTKTTGLGDQQVNSMSLEGHCYQWDFRVRSSMA